MAWTNIPAELRARQQWVCCGENKVPINPRTRQSADPTDPRTWATFEEACMAGFRYIGYVFAPDDPYTGIDLDDKLTNPAPPEELERFSKIIEHFNTYTERSASGRGYHLIVKGKIGDGRRRGHVEIYSRSRFFICTGDTSDIPPKPIAARQDLLEQLYAEMGPSTFVPQLPDEDPDETRSDAEIHEMALAADNGAKYEVLTRGPESWRDGGYPSQSEADLALIGMLTFYTKSNEQVRRIFRLSPLGQRPKAHRKDYVDRMIARMRKNLADRELPPVDYSFAAPPAPPVATTGYQPSAYPPGFVGELAEWIYATSIRPSREVSLAVALGVMAGMCGRAYNTSTRAGLNLYIAVAAETGVGKDRLKDGIGDVLAAIGRIVPAVSEFRGPAHFASGQALIRTLSERPSIVSVIGEAGLWMQAMSHPRASSAEKLLMRMLLDVYGASGAAKTLESSAYSDREKNTKRVQAPSLTILGETTPETFYAALSPEHVASGLLPRFLIIDCREQRAALNEATDIEMPPAMLQRLADIATTCLSVAVNSTFGNPVPVGPEAAHVLRAFNEHCDGLIRNAVADVEKHLWNRAHLNASKLATLLAVGDSHLRPQVEAHHARWATDFVHRHVSAIASRFANGEVGEDQSDAHMDTAIQAYAAMTPQQRRDAGAGVTVANAPFPLIPEMYFYKRLRLRQPFKSHRLGTKRAIQNELDDCVRLEKLQQIDPQEARAKWAMRTGRLFVVGPAFSGWVGDAIG